MSQSQTNKSSSRSEQAPQTTKAKDLSKKGEELKEKADETIASIDELLDEIDQAMSDTLGNTDVLDFINGYVQRGGQAILLGFALQNFLTYLLTNSPV